jgi:DNA-binding MarR family transcriptional regulator
MPRTDRRQRTKLDTHEYALLATFRYALREFANFSESAAARVGLTAQYYQALLVVRGCPEECRITINDLAQQLLIRHNSAVGLVNRLDKRGLLARERSPLDKRKVYLRLTVSGERVLKRLASVHREELQRIGPQLKQLLRQIARATKASRAD